MFPHRGVQQAQMVMEAVILEATEVFVLLGL